MLAFYVFWVVGPVENRTRYTVREFQDSSLDKAIDVEGDSPNRNCFVAAWKLSDEAFMGGGATLTYLYPA